MPSLNSPGRLTSMVLRAVEEQQSSVRVSRQPGQPVPAVSGPSSGQLAYTGVLRTEKPSTGDGRSCCGTCGQPLGYWTLDWLTGLLDRWGWEEYAPRTHNDACQHQAPMALLAIDLDLFKRINDEHGHPAGDAVLRSAAAVLRHATRTTDVICRYGGDEFLVLAPGIDLDGALALGRRIHEGMRATTTTAESTHGQTVTIDDLTASVGVAVQYPEYQLSLFDLLLQADMALRHAKSLGRDLICIADSTP